MKSRWGYALAALGLAGALAAAEKLDSGPPLANDLGPTELDVSKYPEAMQDGYKLLMAKCSKCHPAHRALNAQYSEPEGDEAAQKAAIEQLKKSNPELFSDKSVWTIDVKIWARYVKRMIAKPGAEIAKEDAKKIYEFLAYDSAARKLKDPKAWTSARGKMLAAFKEKYPEEYAKTYAGK